MAKSQSAWNQLWQGKDVFLYFLVWYRVPKGHVATWGFNTLFSLQTLEYSKPFIFSKVWNRKVSKLGLPLLSRICNTKKIPTAFHFFLESINLLYCVQILTECSVHWRTCPGDKVTHCPEDRSHSRRLIIFLFLLHHVRGSDLTENVNSCEQCRAISGYRNLLSETSNTPTHENITQHCA